jgi:hypothetical protein
MPRNVRNFWIELDVDGQKTRIAAGPRRGGFRMRVYIRNNGEIVCPLLVEGTEEDGELKLTAALPTAFLVVARTKR